MLLTLQDIKIVRKLAAEVPPASRANLDRLCHRFPDHALPGKELAHPVPSRGSRIPQGLAPTRVAVGRNLAGRGESASCQEGCCPTGRHAGRVNERSLGAGGMMADGAGGEKAGR